MQIRPKRQPGSIVRATQPEGKFSKSESGIQEVGTEVAGKSPESHVIALLSGNWNECLFRDAGKRERATALKAYSVCARNAKVIVLKTLRYKNGLHSGGYRVNPLGKLLISHF